jgi:hypothetical protein
MIHELKLFSTVTKDLMFREKDVRWTRRQLSFDTVYLASCHYYIVHS